MQLEQEQQYMTSNILNLITIPMKTKIIAFVFSISLTLSSCIVYHPQSVDIPLIKEKDELRIDAGVSSNIAAHTTISYGVTDKIAIQGFGSYGGGDESYYLQAATGYYKAFENNRVLELYGGFGYGYGDAYKDANPGDLFGDYQLYFTQFNYGKVDCNFAHMDLGFGLKAGYLRSNLLDANYYKIYTSEDTYERYIDNSFLFTPQVFARIGNENLKFNLKIGSSWLYKFTNTDKTIPYSKLNIGIGINFGL